jgi:hypothetical protein
LTPQQPLWEPQISVLTWLGVTGQTDWNYYTDAELPVLARNLRCICERFLSAIPTLMHELEIT